MGVRFTKGSGCVIGSGSLSRYGQAPCSVRSPGRSVSPGGQVPLGVRFPWGSGPWTITLSDHQYTARFLITTSQSETSKTTYFQCVCCAHALKSSTRCREKSREERMDLYGCAAMFPQQRNRSRRNQGATSSGSTNYFKLDFGGPQNIFTKHRQEVVTNVTSLGSRTNPHMHKQEAPRECTCRSFVRTFRGSGSARGFCCGVGRFVPVAPAVTIYDRTQSHMLPECGFNQWPRCGSSSLGSTAAAAGPPREHRGGSAAPLSPPLYAVQLPDL